MVAAVNKVKETCEVLGATRNQTVSRKLGSLHRTCMPWGRKVKAHLGNKNKNLSNKFNTQLIAWNKESIRLQLK